MGSRVENELFSQELSRTPQESLLGETRVGGRRVVDTAGVMRVGRVRGELVFLGDLDGQVGWLRRFARSGEPAPAWFRFEVKMVAAELRGSTASLCLTEYPWSAEWAMTARFRGATRVASGHFDDQVISRYEQDADLGPVLQHVEALSYDPFETDTKFVTAGISLPAAPELDRARRSRRKDVQQVFGLISEPIDALVNELLAHAKVEELLAATERNTLIFNPKSKVKSSLRSEAIEERHRLMQLALRQALAGPPDLPRFANGKLLEKPVWRLAEHIYKDHLNNLNRRISGSAKKTSAYKDDLGHGRA